MRNLLLGCLLLLCGGLKAENKLLLFADYKEGSFTDAFDNWSIQKAGNYMYIYYQSDIPLEDSIYINIEKSFGRKDSNYYYYDYYYLAPDASQKKAYSKYIFTSPGNYRISAYDRKTQKLLQSLTTTVYYLDAEYTNFNFVDTWYYSESRVTFCDKVEDGKLIGQSNTFKFNPEGNNITLYVEQPENRPLKTDHLYIKVFALDDCNKEIGPFSSGIGRDWHWTFVQLPFKDKGRYLVEVYTQDEVFINSSILEIR